MFDNNNNNIYKVSIYNNFSREHNACQNQPHYEHESFQTNVRTQNGKESNSQNTLKTLYVRNLNKNIWKEDLLSFLVCVIQPWSYNS